MADTPTPKVIRNFSDFLQIVPKAEQQQVIAAFQQPNNPNLRRIVEEYGSAYEQRIGNSNLVFASDILESSKLYQHPAPTAPQQGQNNQASGAKGILSALGGAALASVTQDASKSGNIMGELNAEESAKLFAEGGLYEQLQQADDTQALQLLESLHPDTMLDTQYQELRRRAEEAGADAATLEHMDKHQQQERERRQQRRDQLTPEERAKEDAAEQKAREAFLKALRNPNLTEEERKNMLRQYARSHQNRNASHFREMLSRKSGLFGIGRDSIFSPGVRDNLHGKKRKKFLEENKQKEVSQETQREETQGPPEPVIVPIRTPPAPQQQTPEPASSPQTQSPSPQRNPSTSGSPLPLPGGLLKKASLLTSPWFWGAIGCILLFILIVVIIVVIANFLSGPTNPIPQATRVTCGDMQDIATVSDAKGVEQAFGKRFGYGDFGASSTGPLNIKSQNPQDMQAIYAVERQIFSDVCVLFGDISQPGSAIYRPPQQLYDYNRFGNLIEGTVQQRNQDRANQNAKLLHFTYFIIVDTADPLSCAVTMDPRSNTNITWRLHNPNLCPPNKLDFLVAQNLAHTLLMQQNFIAQHGGKGSSVFDDFNNTPEKYSGIMGQDGILPTNDCQTSRNYAENANNQQQINCFADMVGEYFTYPNYTDTISKIPTTSPTTALTNAATSSAILTPSLLLDFPTGKYADYYGFAKINLFDRQDMWIQALAGNTQCPATEPTSSNGMLTVMQDNFNIQAHTNDAADTLNKISQDMGPTVLNLPTSVIPHVYHTVCELSSYKFMQLTGVPKVHIDVYLYYDNKKHMIVNCGEYTSERDPKHFVILLGPCANEAGDRFLFTHELGHVIEAVNTGIFDQFCETVYRGRVKSGLAWNDGRCGPSPYQQSIPTFNCQFDYGVGPFAIECFSDMVGEYLNYQNFIDRTNAGPADAYKIANFPTNFPAYYNWAKNNIFVPVSNTTASNSNNCNNAYDLTTNPGHVNFGDPNCNFSKNSVYLQLQQLDAKNASKWFNVIIPCESGFDPNAWRDPNMVPHTPDPDGAWGLFQMGDQISAQSIAHGIFDNGKIDWPKQISNAVGYNNKIGGNFAYWGCNK